MDNEVTLSPEEIQQWMAQNIDLASEYLAQALDNRADALGRSQSGRLARVIATDAWRVHMNILGFDELWFVGEQEEEEGQE